MTPKTSPQTPTPSPKSKAISKPQTPTSKTSEPTTHNKNKLIAVNGWISVEHDLPKFDLEVLVFTADENHFVAKFEKDDTNEYFGDTPTLGWWDYEGNQINKITHWKNLTTPILSHY
tara:strand:+ start:2307 stop:2657 length:351 start_codon:yes stop_codon:yes gene_type:complete